MRVFLSLKLKVSFSEVLAPTFTNLVEDVDQFFTATVLIRMKLVIFSSCHTFIELFHWYLRMTLTFLFKSAFLWHSLHQCN